MGSEDSTHPNEIEIAHARPIFVFFLGLERYERRWSTTGGGPLCQQYDEEISSRLRRWCQLLFDRRQIFPPLVRKIRFPTAVSVVIILWPDISLTNDIPKRWYSYLVRPVTWRPDVYINLIYDRHLTVSRNSNCAAFDAKGDLFRNKHQEREREKYRKRRRKRKERYSGLRPGDPITLFGYYASTRYGCRNRPDMGKRRWTRIRIHYLTLKRHVCAL